MFLDCSVGSSSIRKITSRSLRKMPDQSSLTFQVTLEEGDETGETAETGDTGGAAKTTLPSEEGGGETEENAAEAGM